MKKYKVKVTSQKKKKVSGKLRTTLLPKAAELWKEKSTVRTNYENLGISAEINNDAAVATTVHAKSGVIKVFARTCARASSYDFSTETSRIQCCA